MKPLTLPNPDTTPGTPEQPVPQRPAPEGPSRVRKFMVPTFGAMLCVMLASSVSAQTGTTSGSTWTDQSSSAPVKGWTLWNDSLGRNYHLQDDQLQRLQDIDARYQKEYSALGKEPWNAPSYRTLSDKRNADIKGILNTDQYSQWNKGSNPGARTGTSPANTMSPSPNTQPKKP